MKATVSRTSLHSSKVRPCKGAFIETIPYIAKVKRVLTPKTEVAGYATCDMNVWVIRFKTLQELHHFVREHGQIVLSVPGKHEGIEFNIEIYDDYRE